MKVIELDKISKSFREKKVLQSISIHVEEKEIFGLLGPSGAGKTTLIKIVTGQLPPTEGESYVFGENSRKLKENNYCEIGMVMDNAGVYDRLSCFDNLKLFAKIYGINIGKIKEALEQVGLAEAGKQAAGKLSKGMKQRLILARAILHKPKLLFLDEPTSGLDPTAAKSIHELLLSLQKEGTTIFLTTHNMDEAAKMCGRIGLLHEGNIVEEGKPEEICLKYNKENRIKIILKNKEQLNLPCNIEYADEIGRLLREGKVAALHSSEPDLEHVFLTLTGRRLE